MLNAETSIRLFREGLLLVLLLSAAPLLVAALTALIVNVFQIATQLQDQTLSFVPKLVAVSIVLAVIAPWMLSQTLRFTHILLESIPLIR
jgi:flagellar biosynthetic protein FliQ